jgi:hypothetical protein
VFLAGEGSNELGSRVGHPAYHTDERPGVLAALLTRVQPNGWEVGGARDWKSIRKFRARGASHADTHNVLGAVLDAKEAGCEVLAFARDLDRDADREEAIKEGIRRVPDAFPRAPDVIGGVAIPTLEGWILALLGQRATETLTPHQAERALTDQGIIAKDGLAMVAVVEEANLDQLPADARSLTAWLAQARAVLPPRVAARSGQPASP